MGDDRHQRRYEDERRQDAVEGRRFVEPLVEAALEAERLADGVGGGERQDPRAQDRHVQQAEAEQQRGRSAGQRLERPGRVLRRLDDDARLPQGGRAGDDDEEVDGVGEDGADEHLDPRVDVVADRDALVHDERLDEELTPGRDRCADGGDDGEDPNAAQVTRGVTAPCSAAPQSGLARNPATMYERVDGGDRGNTRSTLRKLAPRHEQPDAERDGGTASHAGT